MNSQEGRKTAIKIVARRLLGERGYETLKSRVNDRLRCEPKLWPRDIMPPISPFTVWFAGHHERPS